MLGEKPAMAIEIGDSILPFAVNGFVQLFPDFRAFLARMCEMRVDIRDKNREHLRVESGRSRALSAGARPGEHENCVAKLHLHAADGVAISVLLPEAEDASQPIARRNNIAINQMGQQCICGNRAVTHTDSMQRGARYLARDAVSIFSGAKESKRRIHSAVANTCYPGNSMAFESKQKRRPTTLVRAVIEVAFIIFLFYSNLLMGEFTGSSRTGKTLAFALHDIFTAANFVIALISAIIGYLVFETLRRTF